MTYKQIRAEKARVRQVLQWVGDHVYAYQTDLEVYGRPEVWQGALQQFTETGFIRDDCDGFSRFMMAVLLFLGFSFEDIAELVTDVSQKDENPYDHHICAVRIGGVWFYLHCWAFELLSHRVITKGYYNTHQGHDAEPMTIVGYRLASRGNDKWKAGVPA